MDLKKLPEPELSLVEALVTWLRDGADRETLIGLLTQRVCRSLPAGRRWRQGALRLPTAPISSRSGAALGGRLPDSVFIGLIAG